MSVRGIAFGLAVLFVAACGVEASMILLTLDYDPGWPWPGNQRWKDMADNMYAGTPDTTPSSQDYAGASVVVDYGVTGSQLAGTVTATGLKPNFAYQLKLEGSSDTWTNSTLQAIGRDSSGTGYLPFGFVMTDQNGDITAPFVTDSSFHVLWKTPGSPGTFGIRAPGANDGPATAFAFDPHTSSSWYDVDYPAAAGGLYGEWEPGRALPGTLLLPHGDYICKFVLTEESFHDNTGTFNPGWGIWSGAPGGSWASPFKGDISFVVPEPATILLLGLGGLALLRRRRQR